MGKFLYSIFFTVFFTCIVIVFSSSVNASNELTSITTDTYQDSETALPISPLPQPGDSISTNAVVPLKYPGTNITMQVGDVLYSSKSLTTGSSPIVGHVAIVGNDFRIYHVTPGTDADGGGAADSLSVFRTRHQPGQTITVYREKHGYGSQAAVWAKRNYINISQYTINPTDLLSVKNPNYCSKFIWQAFYYGAGYDVSGKNASDGVGIIYPFIFTYSNFISRGSFSA
ncbi:hypothetical protein [Paenibacillus campi]|uniref:hypothetical protein n=1 Tax=Paenibacillus campi TaxID=3106031 RepID=UPI002AFEC2E3|nr:hypothetical protein [Paenibacillus sp. SGZ-1014]